MAERIFEMLSQLKRESANNRFSKAFLLKQQPNKASLPFQEEKKWKIIGVPITTNFNF